MSGHDEHRRPLERLLARDAGVAGAFAASELSSCGECERIVQRHLELALQLEELGRDERDSLALAGRVDAPPGAAEAALRAHVTRGVSAPEAAPSRRDDRAPVPVRVRRVLPRWLGPAAAAAVLLVLLVPFLRDDAPGDVAADAPDDHRVLGSEDGPLHPRGEVEDYLPFRWSVSLPQQGHFIVHVTGEGLDLRSERLYGQEWAPAGTRDWPAKIRWTLEVYRASGPGDLQTSYVAWAER